MTDLDALLMRAEFYARASLSRPYNDYCRTHGLDPEVMQNFAGMTAVCPIYQTGPERFAFNSRGKAFLGFVCEALADDGESTIDLVAWPLEQPELVLSYRGRADILGAEEASNPATYTMGKALEVHRDPLRWLQAGCSGAAIVTPSLARWRLLELPLVAGQDARHGRELLKLAQSVADPARFAAKASVSNLGVAA